MGETITRPGERFGIRMLSVGPMDNNVYLLTCRETRESVLIDAAEEPQRLLEEIESTHPVYILQTHGHPDHVGALSALKDALGVPVGAHRDDAGMLPVQPDFFLDDGDRVAFGAQELKVIHTPGHTPGSVCFLIGEYLISGDTLFPGGPGSTSSVIASFPRIIDSIRSKLFVLPDTTVVLPGHGRSTTIKEELPHLDEWVARGW